ncbi:MAG: hypothetical protein KatS3mg118_0241 [Paracoccaceae bacterium]|nr:MAG: DUF454 domain-containing protein [Alphaproteobacteria bacterium]GIX12282.1 MAG: hypothetical protein KatS3mg118_0241 [Paracoccaceae bacterium]
MRFIWAGFGAAGLALGALGTVLPLLPTVPFLLLAAFCFARSSRRVHDWLVGHRVFGPPIRDWRESGAIGRRAKRLATLSVGAAFALSVALGIGPAILALQALALAGVLVFIWTRPEAAPRADPGRVLGGRGEVSPGD